MTIRRSTGYTPTMKKIPKGPGRKMSAARRTAMADLAVTLKPVVISLDHYVPSVVE